MRRTFFPVFLLLHCYPVCSEEAVPRVPLFSVHEVHFTGPFLTSKDCPARDISLETAWRHESGAETITVHGFWDGDGRGGRKGAVFTVRFCPAKTGRWTLVRTRSNEKTLNGQKESAAIECIDSDHPGFWFPDPRTGGRWYQRSDGTHPYIFGDTFYSFLSEYKRDGPTGGTIAEDVAAAGRYFKKIRFAVTPDRYPHPKEKPFLDDKGNPTDSGGFSHRPNPAWFHKRVDLAVKTAYREDLICDLILNGPDTHASRSVLKAEGNSNDPAPFLKYVAARYGSFPNVWFCLSNEYDIKKPRYSDEEIARFGRILRHHLAYPVPVSVHARPRDWSVDLNTAPAWHDHVIIQKKLKSLPHAADINRRNWRIGGKVPVINDELAYEGAGDGWSEADVIEAHLGAFIGGGYGTTGYKPAGKEGHYFWGAFKAEEHRSADNLLWLRRQIDRPISFWKMEPKALVKGKVPSVSIFSNVHPEFRAMEHQGREYVLGTNRKHKNIVAQLPRGRWTCVCYNGIEKQKKELGTGCTGRFVFDAPDGRAVLFHFKKDK